MRNKLLPFVLLAMLGVASPALAWNPTGHEQIADIAWTKLNDRAKAKIAAILMAGDTHFRPASITDEPEVRRAFRHAATFPDEIKRNRQTDYEAMIPKMNKRWLPHPDPSDNEQLLAKTWHYYDTPIRFAGKAPKVRKSNALTALNYARAQLTALAKANKKPEMQCWWLYWIEHVTGDLHQPLHCVSSYEFSATGDNGGNGFNILDPADTTKSIRLHFFWDAGIDHAVAEDASNGLAAGVETVTARWSGDPALTPASTDAGDLTVNHWIDTGARLADTQVYTGISRNSAPSLPYQTAQATLCKKQAVLAGTRLAEILNEILAP